MAKESTNIYLVCVYSMFRTALRMLIEAEHGLRIVGEASFAKISPDHIAKSSADLIVCDLSGLGKEALVPLTVPEMGNIPILVLTRNDDVEFYQYCLKVGVRGLLSKEDGADVLYKAIHKVRDGEFWFDRSIMGDTIRHMVNEKQLREDNPAVQKVSEMTDREKQVIELICKGMKNKGIAEKLFITETTVRHHLTSVFNKLEVGTRLELVIYAFKNQLVKLPVNHPTFEANGARTNGVGTNGVHRNGA
jgi:DNA-binding NarL/FixJ family response regulator